MTEHRQVSTDMPSHLLLLEDKKLKIISQNSLKLLTRTSLLNSF